MLNSTENVNDFSRREKIFRGDLKVRNVGYGTPQILPEGKQTSSSFCHLVCLSLIVRQKLLNSLKETEIIMFLHVSALESGYAQNNKRTLFRH